MEFIDLKDAHCQSARNKGGVLSVNQLASESVCLFFQVTEIFASVIAGCNERI